MAGSMPTATKVLGLITVCAIGAGCHSSGLVGTWEAQKSVPTGDSHVGAFKFGSVTFAPDGTYTAHMIYADRQLGESGRWTTEGDMLELTRSGRAYRYWLHDHTLDLTDPDTNVKLSLERYE